MENIILILLTISGFFFVLLLVKQFFPKRIQEKWCAICGAVVMTLVLFLVLLWLNRFKEPLLVGILLGHSSLGIYYLAEKKMSSELLLFRLPLLLTLISIAYVLLVRQHLSIILLFLAVFWLLFIGLYALRTTKLKNMVQKIVKCCKKW